MDLEFWANIATIISLPISIIALIIGERAIYKINKITNNSQSNEIDRTRIKNSNVRRKTMELCCTYIETNKFEEVVSFYEKILQIKPNVYTKDRWIEFECGNKLSIYNREFDEEKINNNNNVHYNDAYIRDFNKKQKKKVNNIITLNFYTEDLNKEYLRIKDLDIGVVSEIMYVNITEPYYYFTVKDPEENLLEICGDNYAGI